MPARSGQRQELITVETKQEIKDVATGRFVPTWVELRKFWAQVLYKGGGQTADDNRHVENRTVVFVVLYAEDVNSSMRVLYNGEYYAILHTNNWVLKNRTEINCVYKDGSSWS